MCGIAGFCDYTEHFLTKEPYWNTLLKEMRQSLAHRGSNGTNGSLLDHIGLSLTSLHNRDLNRIIYDGEIYNKKELLGELNTAGYQPDTSTDTEILLLSYAHFGPEFVKKINGIFSFALWDDKNQTLLLYRDHIGAKPLYYTMQENTLVFASEPKTLFLHPKVTPRIHSDSLRELLGVGPGHTPGNGIFAGIKEVLPGHYMTFSKDDFRDNTYWDMIASPHTDSYGDTVENVSYLVRDSIERQTVSEVPICSFLSGGIDSSIVTAVAYDRLKNSDTVLDTFSFDFEENDRYFISNSFQPEQDRSYVDIMRKRYPTHHSYLECSQSTLWNLLETAVDARDFPGMTDVDTSLLYFCSVVAKQNKVALTGECADEIFGGYPWFYRDALFHTDGFPWSSDFITRESFLNEDLCKELQLSEYSHARYLETLQKTPLLEGESQDARRHRQIGYLNIKWFMQALLDRMDRISMHSGLVARVPFADHRIMEYVYNVPWEMKYQNGVEKSMLRDATCNLLPKEILSRKKSPYPKTYHPAYEQQLIQKLTAILEDTNAPIQPLIDRKKVQTFMASHKELGRPWYGQLMAGPQLMAYYIQLNYWMKSYHLSI